MSAARSLEEKADAAVRILADAVGKIHVAASRVKIALAQCAEDEHEIDRAERLDLEARLRQKDILLRLTARDLASIVGHLRALPPGPHRLAESVALKLAEDALARIRAEEPELESPT